MPSFCQVIGGGTGGWGKYLSPKSDSELNKISKHFLNGYQNNLRSCDPSLESKKMKNFRLFTESFHHQVIKMAQKIEVAHTQVRKSCSNELESIDGKKRKVFLDCLFEENEIGELKKLLEAKNLKKYLIKNHQLNTEEATELIELFEFIIKLEIPANQDEVTIKPN